MNGPNACDPSLKISPHSQLISVRQPTSKLDVSNVIGHEQPRGAVTQEQRLLFVHALWHTTQQLQLQRRQCRRCRKRLYGLRLHVAQRWRQRWQRKRFAEIRSQNEWRQQQCCRRHFDWPTGDDVPAAADHLHTCGVQRRRRLLGSSCRQRGHVFDGRLWCR